LHIHIKRIAAALIAIYLLYATTLYLLQRRIIFAAWGAVSQPPGDIERWELGPERGYGLLLPAPGDGPHPLVVYAHGNGEVAHDQGQIARRYNQLGFTVLLLEYRGYGAAGGSPSQDGIVTDAAALIQRAQTDPRVNTDALTYHGCSLGGGVLGQLSRVHPPRRLILESTFTSLADLASGFLAPGFLVRDPFPTHAMLPTLDADTLLLHGERDPLIPHAHSLRNRDAARRATHHTIPGGQHMLPDRLTWPLIEAWLSAHTPPASAAPSPPM
jgi:uncharacterized protein